MHSLRRPFRLEQALPRSSYVLLQARKFRVGPLPTGSQVGSIVFQHEAFRVLLCFWGKGPKRLLVADLAPFRSKGIKHVHRHVYGASHNFFCRRLSRSSASAAWVSYFDNIASFASRFSLYHHVFRSQPHPQNPTGAPESRFVSPGDPTGSCMISSKPGTTFHLPSYHRR